MPIIINLADLVTSSGKTIREENLEMVHTLELYTLVEINSRGSKYDGLRLYVANHTRDCDGTPLYSLTHDVACVGYRIKNNDAQNEGERLFSFCKMGAYANGFSDDSLTVVKSAKQVVDEITKEWLEADGQFGEYTRLGILSDSAEWREGFLARQGVEK